MVPWSVRARAGMPNAFASATRSLTLHRPSRSEYWEWQWRWTKDMGERGLQIPKFKFQNPNAKREASDGEDGGRAGRIIAPGERRTLKGTGQAQPVRAC